MACVSAQLRHFDWVTEENLGVRTRNAEESNPWIVISAPSNAYLVCCRHAETALLLCYLLLQLFACGPDSSVGIATDYRLDVSGPNPGGDEIFRPSRPALGARPAFCKMGTGSFPGVKYGRCVLLTTHPFWCRGHGIVELYLYPPSGPHRACNGINLPLPSIICCHK